MLGSGWTVPDQANCRSVPPLKRGDMKTLTVKKKTKARFPNESAVSVETRARLSSGLETSVSLLLDWLSEESSQGKHFNIQGTSLALL